MVRASHSINVSRRRCGAVITGIPRAKSWALGGAFVPLLRVGWGCSPPVVSADPADPIESREP